jgi:hypothetical protein
MFGNFAKIGRAAGASPIWQISIISMTKLDSYVLLNVNIIFSRQSPVLSDFQPKFGAFVRIFI